MSTKGMFQKEKEKDRRRMLADSCSVTDRYPVRVPYDKDEMTNFKNDQAQLAIKIMDVTKEKKEIASGFTARLKGFTEEQGSLLEKIKNKYEDVEQDVFGIAEYDLNDMQFFDEFGNFIYSRPLNPEERQGGLNFNGNVVNM